MCDDDCGSQLRSRAVSRQALNGGTECSGPSAEQQACKSNQSDSGDNLAPEPNVTVRSLMVVDPDTKQPEFYPLGDSSLPRCLEGSKNVVTYNFTTHYEELRNPALFQDQGCQLTSEILQEWPHLFSFQRESPFCVALVSNSVNASSMRQHKISGRTKAPHLIPRKCIKIIPNYLKLFKE